MYALTICFGPTGTNWRLLFKTKESLEKQRNEMPVMEQLFITDDFGQQCTIKTKQIHGTMIEDLDESKVANVEMALHGARTQASAQQRAEADPTLRAARFAQGPAVINPMGNGRWPS